MRARQAVELRNDGAVVFVDAVASDHAARPVAVRQNKEKVVIERTSGRDPSISADQP